MSPRGRQRRRRGRDLTGILLLDKPVGISSNQALQAARRLFDAAKGGHTGNLDVAASGLLPVCFGEATKVSAFLLDADKHYVSEFMFGRRTSTGDAEGEVVSERPVGELDSARLTAEMARFTGAIRQVPPMHSAIKHQGQPLYRLAHQGIEIERREREVTIHHFGLLDWQHPYATVDIRCSKGTYVRTLAEDLGEALGCGAHVSALRREGAGPFELDHAHTLGQLEALRDAGGLAALDACLLPMDAALAGLPEVRLSADAAYYLARGQAVFVPRAPAADLLRLYDGEARFMGVGQVQADGRVAPRRLLRQAPAGGSTAEG